MSLTKKKHNNIRKTRHKRCAPKAKISTTNFENDKRSSDKFGGNPITSLATGTIFITKGALKGTYFITKGAVKGTYFLTKTTTKGAIGLTKGSVGLANNLLGITNNVVGITNNVAGIAIHAIR